MDTPKDEIIKLVLKNSSQRYEGRLRKKTALLFPYIEGMLNFAASEPSCTIDHPHATKELFMRLCSMVNEGKITTDGRLIGLSEYLGVDMRLWQCQDAEMSISKINKIIWDHNIMSCYTYELDRSESCSYNEFGFFKYNRGRDDEYELKGGCDNYFCHGYTRFDLHDKKKGYNILKVAGHHLPQCLYDIDEEYWHIASSTYDSFDPLHESSYYTDLLKILKFLGIEYTIERIFKYGLNFIKIRKDTKIADRPFISPSERYPQLNIIRKQELKQAHGKYKVLPGGSHKNLRKCNEEAFASFLKVLSDANIDFELVSEPAKSLFPLVALSSLYTINSEEGSSLSVRSSRI